MIGMPAVMALMPHVGGLGYLMAGLRLGGGRGAMSGTRQPCHQKQ